MSALYFAEDGSWGDADGITILDEDATEHFTDAMWDRIRDAGDMERQSIAEHFSYNGCVTTNDMPACETCGLTEDEVN